MYYRAVEVLAWDKMWCGHSQVALERQTAFLNMPEGAGRAGRTPATDGSVVKLIGASFSWASAEGAEVQGVGRTAILLCHQRPSFRSILLYYSYFSRATWEGEQLYWSVPRTP